MAFAVIAGGDERQDHLAVILRESGYETACVFTPAASCLSKEEGLRRIRKADLVILPLPLTHDGIRLSVKPGAPRIGLTEILSACRPGARIFGGKVPEEVTAYRRIEDYYREESLLQANAVSTAEGALGLAVTTVPFTLRGSVCAVAGSGRIGSRLVLLLQAVGAKVRLYARDPARRRWARKQGIPSFKTEQLPVSAADIVFNTIPHPILTPSDPILVKGAWYMELASPPGGCVPAPDTSRYIAAPSLPGRFAPVTAARDIAAAIENLMDKE